MTIDQYIALYADVCDVVERTYQGIPLDEPGMGHTSDEARKAANRIFALCGIMEPDGFDEYMAAHMEKIRQYQEKKRRG